MDIKKESPALKPDSPARDENQETGQSSYVPDLEVTRVKVALAYRAYRENEFRLVEANLNGMTHLLSSRQGLYAFNEDRWALVAHGFFFGITLLGSDIYVFESCDLPRAPTAQGRVVKLTVREGVIATVDILARGLDNGCHQMDFLDGRLHVLDTYNQALLRFAPGEQSWETLSPLPTRPVTGWTALDSSYHHVNTLLAVGDRRLLLLHNGAEHTRRNSWVAVYDADWQPVARLQLDGLGCHGLALLEDGTLLSCGSLEGNLISPDGLRVKVSPYMTRGLAVGADSIVVGGSHLANREGRLRNPGTVTFLDRGYRILKVLDVPGAPTEIRRLDGQDYGLSSFLRGVPWGASMKEKGQP